jgi:aryl-alcohol dehydrogenase-like predicted oxidoreductase
MAISRRGLLRRAALSGAGAVVLEWIARTPAARAAVRSSGGADAEGVAARAGEVPRRPFGKTGVEVSALGLGGYHLGSAGSEREATRIVHEALDAGVTFLDNAWEYHDGRSEEWMGKALEGRRERAFLMTKVCTHGRDRREAIRQLEDSLRRLRTDHLDLWQIHECIYDNDPEWHFAKDGVVEALTQAKREGKTRLVGFTGHKSPAIHLAMLEREYPFDACQLPPNCLDASFHSFERDVVPRLRARGVAVIGMKSLGGGYMVRSGGLPAVEALRYAMSLPVATTVSGIDSVEVLQQNLAVARGFAPMSEEEMQATRERWTRVAADGRFELYKTSKRFDGAIGRAQHGFPTEKELAC